MNVDSSHKHLWFRCYSQLSPRVDVYDCQCGLRRRVSATDRGLETEEIGFYDGGSINNCLVNLQPETNLFNTLAR